MIKIVAALIVAILCVVLVVIGQSMDGWGALGIMLAGLAGLLVLLALYNRRYR